MKNSYSYSEYLNLYPQTPKHMVNIPEEKSWVLDSGFIKIHHYFQSTYPDNFIHWTLSDVRLYWGPNETPFRIYIQDYDDWNVEALFPSKESALLSIQSLIQNAPITTHLLLHLNYHPR